MPGQEPYCTLATYRTVKNYGLMLGMYYQMAVLNNKKLYDAILPQEMGYPTFTESLKKN